MHLEWFLKFFPLLFSKPPSVHTWFLGKLVKNLWWKNSGYLIIFIFGHIFGKSMPWFPSLIRWLSRPWMQAENVAKHGNLKDCKERQRKGISRSTLKISKIDITKNPFNPKVIEWHKFCYLTKFLRSKVPFYNFKLLGNWHQPIF